MLKWLSPDREEAAVKYERIRLSLIKKFTWSRCREPEDLADKVFDIVIGKISQLLANYKGKPERYFYGVAKNLILQKDRRPHPEEIPEHLPDKHDPEAEAEKTAIEACQRKCLNELDPKQKKLIIDYYQNGSQQNPEFRKNMAVKYGIEPGKLRVDIYRSRIILNACLEKCLTTREIVPA